VGYDDNFVDRFILCVARGLLSRICRPTARKYYRNNGRQQAPSGEYIIDWYHDLVAKRMVLDIAHIAIRHAIFHT
jgi:hypothetical protein